MSSQAQIDANRRNAEKSTGPRTEEGKARVRLNALIHGLRARTVVMPWEDAKEFEELCQDIEDSLRPANRAERLLVEQIAICHWKLAAFQACEKEVQMKMKGDEQQRCVERIDLYRRRFEGSMLRTHTVLNSVQKMRERRELREEREAAKAKANPQPQPEVKPEAKTAAQPEAKPANPANPTMPAADLSPQPKTSAEPQSPETPVKTI